MDDFIEQDVFSDDEVGGQDDREVARPGRKPFSIEQLTAGLDEASMEDYYAGFGRGDDYAWALEREDMEEAQKEEQAPQRIEEVFEPGQLAEKMLTEDDMRIRQIDVPERFQLVRKGIPKPDVSDDEAIKWFQDEATWIGELLWHKISHSPDVSQFGHDPEFKDAYNKAIFDVITFMNKDQVDVPFIYRNRRDYFVYKPPSDKPESRYDIEKSIRILSQSDLWDISEMDLRYQALAEKRQVVKRTYASLSQALGIKDSVFEEMVDRTASFEEVQDVQDYLYFQYSAQIKDMRTATATNGTNKRPTGKDNWDTIRSGQIYNWTRAIGCKTDDLAKHALLGLEESSFQVDDAPKRPDDLADEIAAMERTTSALVERHGKAIFVEELVMNPRMRKFIRNKIYAYGAVDCLRTEKGKKEITEDHSYYEFKYVRNLDFSTVASRPDMYLRMLKAESEGLVEVRIRLLNKDTLVRQLQKMMDSRGTSEVSNAWNNIRKDLMPTIVARLEKVIARGAKDALKTECETQLARNCRIKFNDRLDVAPFPGLGDEGADRGPDEQISVLAMSNGQGVYNRDAIVWVYVDIGGRVIDHGKFADLRARKEDGGKVFPAGADNQKFIDLVMRRQPDVIGIAGFSVETRRLFTEVRDILGQKDEELKGRNADSDDEDQNKIPPAVLVQDEVARMYHTSDRAAVDFPQLSPIGRYCVALARYLRSPMHEYAALGKALTSIAFDPNQDLLPEDKLLRYLEHALIDMVNMVGVDLEDAINDKYEANLLQYVCGLGPRKAARLLEVVQQNGGIVHARVDLIGNEEQNKAPAMGPVVWNNCASFLYLLFQDEDQESDPLDNTRIHPEDYDIAKKIAGDALGLDEEDIQDETEHHGSYAVVRRLMTEKTRAERYDALDELDLHEYADQLEKKFGQRKRATLENIREELIEGYEELRMKWQPMTPREIFTMLTGETPESLPLNSIVPVKIRRIFADHIDVKLDCGVDGSISSTEYPKDVGDGGLDPRSVYSQNQTVQAKLLFLNLEKFSAGLALRREESWDKKPYGRPMAREPNEWDTVQEIQDRREADKEKEITSGRTQRVVKHPLFKPYNSKQAVEWLASQHQGDLVIRPSSKGPDHLAVTWKVADNVFQHIDVLELDKENEFALGKSLKVGKYTYSDLDELIANHVNAMSKKVTEIMADDKYKDTSKTETGKFLILCMNVANARYRSLAHHIHHG
jgi:transcription elongation factor SPT6